MMFCPRLLGSNLLFLRSGEFFPNSFPGINFEFTDLRPLLHRSDTFCGNDL